MEKPSHRFVHLPNSTRRKAQRACTEVPKELKLKGTPSNCLVLSREWGNEWVMGTTIGDYIGTTKGIHSPIPY